MQLTYKTQNRIDKMNSDLNFFFLFLLCLSVIYIGVWYRNYQHSRRLQQVTNLEQIWKLTEGEQIPGATRFQQIQALEKMWQLPAKRES
ncbi:hypothetical protein NUACC21_63500 [Scytonema sp. NUACC21]